MVYIQRGNIETLARRNKTTKSTLGRIAKVISLPILAAALTAGCTGTYSYEQLSRFTALKFTSTGVTRNDPEVKTASIHVAAGADTTLPDWVVNHIRFFGSGRIDLNRNILITVSRGVTDYDWNLIIVTDIWQSGRTIFVRAQVLNWPLDLVVPKPEMTVTPADVVIVSKDQIVGTGNFTFLLLNDYGAVMAATSAVIKPASIAAAGPH